MVDTKALERLVDMLGNNGRREAGAVAFLEGVKIVVSVLVDKLYDDCGSFRQNWKCKVS